MAHCAFTGANPYWPVAKDEFLPRCVYMLEGTDEHVSRNTTPDDTLAPETLCRNFR
ncbi:hypothetical protein EYZ11_013067 [Aspergillus tanneri]|uniref:Uncharacterized protein n=1 Tax=Aspergillus tanneri TaxID=1220188 RepID=A0A4S3IYL1_9EURO|nr:hypothetical protein EYZ11_013067 [Aspergillus tanneri]